jgi:hypothetical protein
LNWPTTSGTNRISLAACAAFGINTEAKIKNALIHATEFCLIMTLTLPAFRFPCCSAVAVTATAAAPIRLATR